MTKSERVAEPRFAAKLRKIGDPDAQFGGRWLLQMRFFAEAFGLPQNGAGFLTVPKAGNRLCVKNGLAAAPARQFKKSRAIAAIEEGNG